MSASFISPAERRRNASRIASYIWFWFVAACVLGCALLGWANYVEATRCDEASMRRAFFEGLAAPDEATRSAAAERLARCMGTR